MELTGISRLVSTTWVRLPRIRMAGEAVESGPGTLRARTRVARTPTISVNSWM
jgi:hypothetical protein